MPNTSLKYKANDSLPLWISLLQGLQHVSIITIAFVFPVAIVRAIGGNESEANFLLSMSMMAGAIGTFIMASKKLGGGWLCPLVCSPSFMAASLLAAKMGGIQLMLGMTLVAGLSEAVLSRFIHRLRFLFPTEVVGVIVALVGISVIKMASHFFLGISDTHPQIDLTALFISGSTLIVIMGLAIWGHKQIQPFAVLIGLVYGYAISYTMGVLGQSSLQHIEQSNWFHLAILDHPGWAFSWVMVIPFGISLLCSSLKTMGDITTCQKISDEKWKRPDMKNMRGGILADASGSIAAGILGGMGQSTSSSNVGMGIATGIASRYIGFSAAGILFILSLSPRFASIFTIMPAPVMGALLLFTLCFMIVAGFQIVMSRMMDKRRTLTVGLAVIFGLIADFHTELFSIFPNWLQPIFSSSLTCGAITAILLNLLFRIGIKSKAKLEASSALEAAEKIFPFMDKAGGNWGARHDTIIRASSAMSEICSLATGPISFDLKYDEFLLEIRAEYEGIKWENAKSAPTAEALIENEQAQHTLSCLMISRFADSLKAKTHENKQVIKLKIEP